MQDDFEPTQEPTAQDDNWGSWGDSDESWVTPASQGSSAESIGDSWGETTYGEEDSTPSQNTFISQEDDGWGNTSGVVETPQPTDTPDDFAGSIAEDFKPKKFKVGTLQAAFIVGGALIVLALVFLFLDKVHLSKKPNVEHQDSSPKVETTSNPETNKQENQGSSNTQQVDVDSVVLVEIPESMKLNYNSDVLTANGKVISKLKYVQGHQVLYCINIGVAFGSSTEVISYYCNLSSFNAVKEGDVVVLSYQQVNDSYISVMSISK